MGSERSKSKRSGLSRLKAASKGLAKCIAELKAAKAAKQRVLTTPESERIRIRQWVTNAREVYDDKEKLLKHPFQLSTRWTIGGWEGVPAASCTFEKFLEKYAFTLYGGWTEALDENGKPLLELVNGERTQIYRLYPLKLLPGWVETETYAHGEPLYYKYPLKSNGEPDLTELLETTDDRPSCQHYCSEVCSHGTPDLSDLEEYHDEQNVRPGSGLTEEEMKHAMLFLSDDDLTKDSHGNKVTTKENVGTRGMRKWMALYDGDVTTARHWYTDYADATNDYEEGAEVAEGTFEKFLETHGNIMEITSGINCPRLLKEMDLSHKDLTTNYKGDIVTVAHRRGKQGKKMLIEAAEKEAAAAKEKTLKDARAKSQREAEAAKEAKLAAEAKIQLREDIRQLEAEVHGELAAEKEKIMKESRAAKAQRKSLRAFDHKNAMEVTKVTPVGPPPGRRLIARFQRESRRCISS